MKRIIIILACLLLHSFAMYSQETGYGPGYRTMLMNNPAFAGLTGDGTLRLAYLNFYPGNAYNLHSFYASYDSYLEPLHGGAGLWISDDHLGGIINDTRGSISYAYSLQAGKELFINAGLSAGFYYRRMNFSDAVLPDMIDPTGGVMFPAGESFSPRSNTVFDAGTGFVFIYRDFLGGVSVNHLFEPDMSEHAHAERLRRKVLFNASWNIPLGENRSTGLRPSCFLEFQGDYIGLGAGSSIESKSLAASFMLIGNNNLNLDIQGGFSVKTGRIGLFYSYRFNVASADNLIPLSMLHQAGLNFSLNSVDKRNVPGTISLPEL
ncbi:MAG TPA: PorP/SprF family type IX secretion system membrane protein [Bacteroidales bacterium]|nr:PorP/SprF family type IX secretion system membrane protein [Bacteroidales bacterium]